MKTQINTQEKIKSSSFFHTNMSLITTFLSCFVFLLSFIPTAFSSQLKNIGLFALSGAVTNWIAIHMLFEKVPMLYGSGVIQIKFKEFKNAIYTLFMEEFFTEKNFSKFFSNKSQSLVIKNALDSFTEEVDYQDIYQKLVNSIIESPLGSMLSMFGGPQALEPVKPHLIKTIKKTLKELTEQAEHSSSFKKAFSTSVNPESIKPKIEKIIQGRLDELTPKMVKEMVQKIIKEHLGWLVLWGGVFGGLIGLITTLLSS